MVSPSALKLVDSVMSIRGVSDLIPECTDELGNVLPHILLGRVAGLLWEAIELGNEERIREVLDAVERPLEPYDDEIYELVQVGFLEMVRNIGNLDVARRYMNGKTSLIASTMSA